MIIRESETGHVTKLGGRVFLKRDADVDEGPMIGEDTADEVTFCWQCIFLKSYNFL